MTNKILRDIRGEDDLEPETYHSRQESTLSLEGGRFANQTPIRTIVGGASYPRVSPTPLTAPQCDHGFRPERDRVDQVTSMTFDQDLTTLSGEPAEPCLVSSPPKLDEKALPNQQPSRSFSRRSLDALRDLGI
jgi:hypothetical protein